MAMRLNNTSGNILELLSGTGVILPLPGIEPLTFNPITSVSDDDDFEDEDEDDDLEDDDFVKPDKDEVVADDDEDFDLDEDFSDPAFDDEEEEEEEEFSTKDSDQRPR